MRSIRSQAATASLVAFLGLGLLWVWQTSAQHDQGQDRIPNVTEYLERLERPERDQDQKPAQVMEALALKPGMSVADLGAGPVHDVEDAPLAELHVEVQCLLESLPQLQRVLVVATPPGRPA